MSGNRPHWWRQGSMRPAGLTHDLVVVADIDRSLLDAGLDEQPSALDVLMAHGVPLVINSSRTRAEIERLHRTWQLRTPFISEHGSALVIPHGCFPAVPARAHPAVGGHVIEFGRPYPEVLQTLARTGRELQVKIVHFGELTIPDVAAELGVSSTEAQLAKLREYSELFRIVDASDAARTRFVHALRRRGLRCWPTGRHLLAAAVRDPGESVLALRRLWREAWGEPLVIGLANSDDDIAWLRHADLAIAVQNEHPEMPARIVSRLPLADFTRARGRSWNELIAETVGAVLRLPRWSGSARRFTTRLGSRQ
jgi:mannosyl-3-phosphoglycerate phosphatase